VVVILFLLTHSPQVDEQTAEDNRMSWQTEEEGEEEGQDKSNNQNTNKNNSTLDRRFHGYELLMQDDDVELETDIPKGKLKIQILPLPFKASL
jgi:hypothetical protein